MEEENGWLYAAGNKLLVVCAGTSSSVCSGWVRSKATVDNQLEFVISRELKAP